MSWLPPNWYPPNWYPSFYLPGLAGNDLPVSAASRLNLSGTPSASVFHNYQVYIRSAASHFNLSGTSSSTVQRADFQFVVSASSTLNLRPQAAETVTIGTIKPVSAASRLNLSGHATGLNMSPTSYVVSAASHLNLSGTAFAGGPPQNYSVSATSHVLFNYGATSSGARTVSAASRLNLSGSPQGHKATFSIATSHLGLSVLALESLNTASPPRIFVVHGVSTIHLSGSPGPVVAHHQIPVVASSTIHLSGSSDLGSSRSYFVRGVTTLRLHEDAAGHATHIVHASASSRLGFSGIPALAGSRNVAAASYLNLAGVASANIGRLVHAVTTVSLSGHASAARDVHVTAVTSLGFATDEEINRLYRESPTSALSLHGGATASVGSHEARGAIHISGLAFGSTLLASGVVVPGGDSNAGLTSVVYRPYSGRYPASFAETPSGLVLVANGVDPMIRWDGLAARADTAGVLPPPTPVVLGAAGAGRITGIRYAFCRFLDAEGRPSSLSPASGPLDLGRDGWIESVVLAPGVAKISSPGHGLASGVAVLIDGVGLPPIDGMKVVTVLDADTFTVPAIGAKDVDYLGGGSWVFGYAQVVYQSCPVPAEKKVVRRQFLRNLDGDADTFYVDIDTADLTSTVLVSTLDDPTLSSREGVPLGAEGQLPYALRYLPPPSHKSCLVVHQGRVFAAGEVTVVHGNVSVVSGSRSVVGIATEWPASLAGRYLYVASASRPYEIASVDPASQSIVLVDPYADPSAAYSTYAIRPAPGERRLLYYSEPAEPEAWPPWNAIALPEDGDEITGLMSRVGYLYIFGRRHIYRLTCDDDPGEGRAIQAAQRGCINNRCHIEVEDSTYCLDETGIYRYDNGQQTEPVSTPVQTLFQSDPSLGQLMVDWSADTTLWHGVHDPVRQTVRWFVPMVGYGDLFHAICYDYRQSRWWIERYPWPILSGAVGTVGHRRSIVGSDARHVFALAEGTMDAVADSDALGGAVGHADQYTLTDPSAGFPANLANAPLTMTSGVNAGLSDVIAGNTSTVLTLLKGFPTPSAPGDGYLVGGVPWAWRSGVFEFLTEDEDTNDRSIELTFQPLVTTDVNLTADVRLYFDHSDQARTWDYEVHQDGVDIGLGESRIRFGLMAKSLRSGWAEQRFGSHEDEYAYGTKYVTVELSGVQAAESVRIFYVVLNGCRPVGGSG